VLVENLLLLIEGRDEVVNEGLYALTDALRAVREGPYVLLEYRRMLTGGWDVVVEGISPVECRSGMEGRYALFEYLLLLTGG
jgi:hypothetical protein